MSGLEVVFPADPGKQFADVGPHLILPGAGDAERKRDVVERRQMRQQAKLLKHDPDPSPHRRQFAARLRADIDAEQPDRSGGGMHRQIEKAEQRRFAGATAAGKEMKGRSAEHTSELQSLMRISYAVFCLKKK